MDGTSRGDVLRTYVIGLCMGTADGVPGVSGGTIALIAGIYARLIDAITELTPGNGLRFLAALVPPDTGELRDVLDEIDAVFLFPLGFGVLSAVVLVTRVIEYANHNYPVVLFGFFFGLIAASVVVLWRQVSLERSRHYVAAVAGFLLAFVVSGDLAVLQGHNVVLVFAAGAIAVSAMILPGISGSLLLIILGQYQYMIDTLGSFVDYVAAIPTGGDLDRLAEPGTTVLVFVVGAVIGLLTVARVVDRALERDPATTLAFLVALVVGALRAPIAEIGGREGIGWTAETITTFAAVSVVGAVVLYGLDYFFIDVEVDVSEARG